MAESRFVIGGTEYPVPEWVSFTMDESEILYAKARLTLDQADDDIVFSPGLLSALMLIAYMRGNPGVSRKAAEKIIGAIPLTEAIEHLAGDDEEEEDAVPSQGRNEISELAPPANSDVSTPSSGFVGGNGSGNPAVLPPDTGMPASATPPTSDQATLVRSPPIS